ncbi:MAG: hypothetical protein AAGC99_08220 [Pseudomonadota bacterium]
MSDIRAEIRAILHEEIAALRTEATASVERVRITSTAELNRFAQDLIRRAGSSEFCQAVAAGTLTFELAGPSASTPALVTSPAPSPAAAPVLDKTLITERDIAGLPDSTRSLRLGKNSRLTPLARDEAQRRGIRIERIAS